MDVFLGARGGSGVHFLARSSRSELEFNMAAPTIGDFDSDKSFEGRIYDSRRPQKLIIGHLQVPLKGEGRSALFRKPPAVSAASSARPDTPIIVLTKRISS